MWVYVCATKHSGITTKKNNNHSLTSQTERYGIKKSFEPPYQRTLTFEMK